MSLLTRNEIRTTVGALEELLEEEIGFVVSQITDAAQTGNMDWVQHCAKQVEMLQRSLRSLKAIEEHAVDVLENTLSFEPDSVQVSASGLRTLAIAVSQGMINQNLLTLTDAKKSGKVSLGEKFKIELPDGTAFETELCDPGNKLRERGMIRRFYDEWKITDGDKVVLTETSQGTWKLSADPRSLPEYIETTLGETRTSANSKSESPS